MKKLNAKSSLYSGKINLSGIGVNEAKKVLSLLRFILVWFYGISTIIGYFMTNTVCTCVFKYVDTHSKIKEQFYFQQLSLA